MNKFHSIASGSKSNSYVIESNDSSIIIDQGLSFKRFREKCEELGVNLSKISGIFLTHEHGDHFKGVPLTAKSLNIPVYCSSQIVPIIKDRSKYDLDIIPLKKDIYITVADFKITPFSVMHDSVDPLGFSVTLPGEENFVIATDTGVVTNYILKYISNSSYLVLEANHDRAMLMKNPKYPWEIKARIKSNYGHLSNEQSIDVLNRMNLNTLKTLVFAHLSEENNCEKKLRSMFEDFCTSNNHNVHALIARQQSSFSMLLT